MERVVTGCKECPLFDANYNGCGHPDNIEASKPFEIYDDDNGDAITPEWCPLISEPITITLKQE